MLYGSLDAPQFDQLRSGCAELTQELWVAGARGGPPPYDALVVDLRELIRRVRFLRTKHEQ